MRKLLVLAVLGGIAYWFFNRGGARGGPQATIGYVDGSSVTLTPGAPDHELLVAIAAGALAP